MPLQRRALPLDGPDWLFELKYDGFRALAVIERGRGQLISRTGHAFASFAELADAIAASLPHVGHAVLDGEIVCLDRSGKPQFRDLLFRRADPCFFAFDLIAHNEQDCRFERLIDRKQELRRLLARLPADSRLRYADHVVGAGIALFERVCELGVEGIVAKHKHGRYVADREHSTGFKVLNPAYSQMHGRADLFERDRHSELVPGWYYDGEWTVGRVLSAR